MHQEECKGASDKTDEISPNLAPSGIEKDRQIQEYQNKLRRLASELAMTEARERRSIASDLHDHIGQALAYVSQKVSVLRGNAVFSGNESDFAEILSILEQTIRYVRDLTVEVSPPVLYELGLLAAIEWLADRIFSRHGLEVVIAQRGVSGVISDDIRAGVFKAVQEILTNSVRHARAQKVKINISWFDDKFEITVEDDGCGFDTASIRTGLSKDGCFGLFSIRERISDIGGVFKITSTPGQGTKVSIISPYIIDSEGTCD